MPGSGTPVIQVSRNFDIRDRIITETDDPFYSFAALNGSSSGYDSVGNLTYYQDLVIGNWNYNYDTLNRLTTAQNTATTSIAPQYINAVGCWTYDGFGNRTLETFNNAPTPCASGPNGNLQRTVTTPTSSNQVSGFTYDLAGNVLYDNLDANYYRYDAEGRLCAVGYPSGSGGTLYEQYLYDASGARIGKGTLTSLPSSCNAPTSANQFTSTLQYLVGLGGEQVTELNSSSGEVQHTNVFTGGKLLATYDFSGNAPNGLHFALADPLGTMRVQVTPTGPGTGETELSCMSLPFGNDLGNPRVTNCLGPGTDATEHHFTGKERDTESGNDYFGARYYSSSMGRFMSPDWSAKEDPVPYAQLDDPQSLNLYAYVRNNPLSKADPDGHCPECAVWEQEAEPYIEDYGSQAGQWLQQNGTEAAAWVGATAAAGYAAVKGWFSYKPGADFSPKTKKDTATAAAGTCALCGTKTTPAEKSKKGVTPPSNEGQTDHKKAKSKGGTNDPSNAQHTCRKCNREKSDKDVPPAPAPPPPPPPPPPPTPPPPAGA
jgi:RHS repeat-associated protein